MKGRVLAAIAGSLLIVSTVAGAPQVVTRFATEPPLAHTGGFGEPTCHTCHFDEPLDDEAGRLVVQGLPATYTPGERYRLVVQLSRPEMQRSGFQLAVRRSEGPDAGAQAGILQPVDERVSVLESTRGILYASHNQEGSVVTPGKAAEWTLEWTAPTAGGPVVLHVVGNAANGDDSPFADFVYRDSVRSVPKE